MFFVKKIEDFYQVINKKNNNIRLFTTSNMEKWSLSNRSRDRIFKTINKESEPVKLAEDQKGYIELSAIFKLDWIYSAPEKDYLKGGFRFSGLFESLCLKSKLLKSLKDDNVPYPETEEETAFLNQLNPFVKAFDDRKFYGCFLRNTPNFPPPIYFYDYGLYFPMNVDLDGYLDAMFASFATYRWQYFYIDEFPPEQLDRMGKLFRTLNRKNLYQELKKITESLPKAFPDHDFSYHKERLDFLGSILLK